jgi:hypothetical protein
MAGIPPRPKPSRVRIDGQVQSSTLDRIDRYATKHGITLHCAVGEIVERAVAILNIDAIR